MTGGRLLLFCVFRGCVIRCVLFTVCGLSCVVAVAPCVSAAILRSCFAVVVTFGAAAFSRTGVRS